MFRTSFPSRRPVARTVRTIVVLATNPTSVSLSLRDFRNNLVSRGWMAKSKFLTTRPPSGTDLPATTTHSEGAHR